MSYSHTKRRKYIAYLKKHNPAKWRKWFLEHCAAIRIINDGPLIGSVQDIVNSVTK